MGRSGQFEGLSGWVVCRRGCTVSVPPCRETCLGRLSYPFRHSGQGTGVPVVGSDSDEGDRAAHWSLRVHTLSREPFVVEEEMGSSGPSGAEGVDILPARWVKGPSGCRARGALEVLLLLRLRLGGLDPSEV